MFDSENQSDFTDNQISEMIANIADSLTIDENDECFTVSFAGKALKLNVSEDVKPIVDAINNCPQLLTLNLEGNTLGIEAAKQIGKSLESRPSLKYALLKDLFTGRLKTEIPDAIMYLSSGVMLSSATLHTLDLSDNAFGPIGMKSVLPFLESETCASLQVLRLNNNGLGTEGGKLLSIGLNNLTNLKTFVCGRNRLEIVGAVAIGNTLAKITTLETLEMPQNGIRGEGIEAIAKAVESNKSLRVLNLNDNNLKGSGGLAIASALQKSITIEVVNFGDCLLKSAGCVAVCNALVSSENPNRLKEVILNGNEIGKQAIKDIINIFSKENALNGRLELNNNNFGYYGIEELKDGLKDAVNLKISDDEGSEVEDNVSDGADNDEGEEETNKDETTLVNNQNQAVLESNLDEIKPNFDIEELTKTIENENNDINDLCSQFVKISVDGYDNSNSTLSDEALQRSEIYIKSAVKKEENEYLAMNALLVKLGLLKKEDGRYERVDDLRGPLSALTHSIKYLSPQQKHVLQAFMNRPNKSVEECGQIKHKLMRALFT